MDDVYQYTNEAVQSNRGSQKSDEQEDVLLNAFNNFGFSQRWTSLVDAVKKQGEQAVNVTRHDLQEFAQILRDDTTETVEKISKSVKPDVKGKGRATGSNAATDETETGDNNQEESMIWSYVRQAQQLPSALRLPDNIDLGKLREEMDQGTRFAEQYLQKFGAEVTQIVNKAINVIDADDDEYPEDQEPEGRKSTSSNPNKRIFATRKERLLAEMRTDPDTFLNQVPGPVIDEVEKKTDEIALILEEFPELRDMMDRLVPLEVSYVLFWQRYFYHEQKIEKEDEKRQIIAEGAQEEDEFKWDSDDEDDAASTQQKKGLKVADGKNEEVDDKEVAAVSPAPLAPVPATDNQATDKSKKPEETKKTTTSEDSDSDWE